MLAAGRDTVFMEQEKPASVRCKSKNPMTGVPMHYRKAALLGSVSTLMGAAGLAGASAADLPVRKAAPVEYVRVCGAFGAGFFYIPGTDTCVRLSGRARFEYAYEAPLGRGQGVGDYSAYRGLARINLDARTQTDYGTLRAFLRIDAASRTGTYVLYSGTQIRIGNAFPGTGIDAFGRVEQFISTDKAFLQFAGFTAGRASSFFDFYAHDFEFMGVTAGSDVSATNLAAYTAILGNGFSATLSMEDPSFRRTPTYSSQGASLPSDVGASGLAIYGQANSLTPVFLGYDGNRAATGVGFVDVVERNRMPDFVGVLRYDGSWGATQLSGAVHEINAGTFANGFIGTNLGAPVTQANNAGTGRPASVYGWAVQGGIKVNLPFIAPGDAFYLQGAYDRGAQMYAGYSAWTGSYSPSNVSIQGAPFSLALSDAVLNPFTGRLQLSTSFSATGAFLHYWSPELRSAFFGSYSALSIAPGARLAQGAYHGLLQTGPGTPGTRYYALSQTLRDSYQYSAGASLIWSPVKDLDIGFEGIYQNVGVQNGRVLDGNKAPGQTASYVNNLANPVRTVKSVDVVQFLGRVQRDF